MFNNSISIPNPLPSLQHVATGIRALYVIPQSTLFLHTLQPTNHIEHEVPLNKLEAQGN
jgi:hypothetical protein